jgi:hypothetical protein
MCFRRIAFLLVSVFFLVSCSTTPAENKHNVDTKERITTAEAENLIGHKPLKDITTDEVWYGMNAQVFSYLDTVKSTGISYLVSSQQVFELCKSFGGMGIQTMCVSDLNNDKVPELLFFYHFGSGMDYTIPGCYTDDRLLGTGFSIINYGGIEFKKSDMQKVEIGKGMNNKGKDNDAIIAGRLVIKDDVLNLEIYDTIPDEIKKSIKMKYFKLP